MLAGRELVLDNLEFELALEGRERELVLEGLELASEGQRVEHVPEAVGDESRCAHPARSGSMMLPAMATEILAVGCKQLRQ